MAVGLSDISGNDWRGLVNSSPATDRLFDEIFGANHFFWPKLPMRKSSIGKITCVRDWWLKTVCTGCASGFTFGKN